MQSVGGTLRTPSATLRAVIPLCRTGHLLDCRLLFGCLIVSIDFGKSLTHCECSSHSFIASRSGTHRPTEEQATVRGAADSGTGRATAADADREVWSRRRKTFAGANAIVRLEPVISEMTEQAESEHTPAHRLTKKSAKHPGRQELPANLPRDDRLLPCTPDQRVCKRCGKETVVIG
jgi:hypothetical protein